ncbi:MAG TPA: hypothetical protein VGH42_06570 [Verrucomicrobiae bacterium]
MKFFDTLYYAVYRFGRSIGQPDTQADATATIWMPTFFILAGFYLYFILVYKLDPRLLPHKSLKPIVEGIGVVVFIASYFIYGKRGKRIIKEYGKSKNQKYYVWLGAIFLIVGLSLPVLMWFLLRAIM